MESWQTTSILLITVITAVLFNYFELIDIYVNGIINAIAFILLSISIFDSFTGRK